MQTSIIPLEEVSSVLAFWFSELEPHQWFKADTGIDNLIKSRFGTVHAAAASCELWHWRITPQGRLAEIIVLDQFSRHIYRNEARAFSCDGIALALAQEALRLEADKVLADAEKTFLFMPFMHSESLYIHDTAMELFDIDGLEVQLEYEKEHRDLLLRFGRYPARNEALGRTSTAEERAYLDSIR
ncbi:DUF924 family protein [Aestuariibacter sp. A3R04]|uniref:DUF924 family protein n=1 Tax=Aestuariibacter sp. A3R04 TaxID=2841571 RepID=UPI001C09C165|nr:DUF924 family protein [Aestuariibacter sp. A3R04]MBU3022643.1 DUF924 domain-containing protein [Aestuariibacter sp. A3R04]